MSVDLLLVIDDETVIDDTYDTEQLAADAARAEIAACSNIGAGKWAWTQETKTGSWVWWCSDGEHDLTMELSEV